MADEVFISYSHHDRAWAEKLATDLRGRGVTVFFDQKSLREGEGWEGQLVEAVKACKHLVCFWSAHAKESEWVQQELAMYRVNNSSGNNAGQKLLFVPLDAQRHTFTNIQNIELPALQAAYAGAGVGGVGAADWLDFVDRVMAARKRTASLQIPVALLTLDATTASFSPSDLKKIETQLGLTAAELQGRYGPRRLDWKPFIGGATIESDLDQSRSLINQWLAQNGVNEVCDWEYPDDRFWTDDEYARVFAGRMEASQPGLIVIDPVAALLVDVQLRLKLFDRCLRLAHVAIVALHPAMATAQETSFREWVARYTVTLLDPYVAPRPVPDVSLNARLGIGVDDMGEVRRLLKSSIGECLRLRVAGAKPAAAALSN